MDETTANRVFLRFDQLQDWKEGATDQARGIPPPPNQKPYPEDGVLIDLRDPAELIIGRVPLIDVIRHRRSQRKFTGGSLSVEELSFLLWAIQGVDDEATHAFREWLAEQIGIPAATIGATLRTVPSAGACHPFEVYLLAKRVNSLEPGIYRYLAMEHKLLAVCPQSALGESAGATFEEQTAAERAAAIVWTALPYRTEWRYGLLAHKMIAQEAGHVCQNLYLACDAIGAGTVTVMYDQARIDELLGIDGEDEFAVCLAHIGKSATHEQLRGSA